MLYSRIPFNRMPLNGIVQQAKIKLISRENSLCLCTLSDDKPNCFLGELPLNQNNLKLTLAIFLPFFFTRERKGKAGT